ncbi:mobilization protein [Pedobacter jeongneungensis]|uniref:mobilization protein n=1 Tax=Pedobacter jeongneungensis TaxID=947309 RepID=UPI0031E29128
MSRPKLPENDKLNRLIRVRVNAQVYQRLTALQKQTDCRSICELARKILSREQITLLHKDASMNGTMEELALIRKELKAIGININQQTHRFHTSQSAAERAFYVAKTAKCYGEVDERVTTLLKLVHQLTMVWLQKS